ncbi:MAG: hypothetical protein ACREX1_07675, partial [Advenella sp.]
VQDFSSFFWTEDEINHRLERLMREAYRAVSEVAKYNSVTLRTAAFIVACSRILESREVRGLYPCLTANRSWHCHRFAAN